MKQKPSCVPGSFFSLPWNVFPYLEDEVRLLTANRAVLFLYNYSDKTEADYKILLQSLSFY
jgi:hypothetical protein